uniref:Uncharacterized protein n=1 Tax=Oryza nivara TaxID=4536 RepID=A0A0E0G989_ORYNI
MGRGEVDVVVVVGEEEIMGRGGRLRVGAWHLAVAVAVTREERSRVAFPVEILNKNSESLTMEYLLELVRQMNLYMMFVNLAEADVRQEQPVPTHFVPQNAALTLVRKYFEGLWGLFPDWSEEVSDFLAMKAGQPILPAREILPAPDASKPRTPPNPNLEQMPPIPRKQSSKPRD